MLRSPIFSNSKSFECLSAFIAIFKTYDCGIYRNVYFFSFFSFFLQPTVSLPSVDLRPKGRGRPQRILLGVWPDEHIRGVIRAVVFRDGHSPHIVKEEPTTIYPTLANYAACNGPEGAVSPGAAAAAAVAAVAQGNGTTHSLFLNFVKIDVLEEGCIRVRNAQSYSKSFFYRMCFREINFTEISLFESYFQSD